jgi:hypothetical protein
LELFFAGIIGIKLSSEGVEAEVCEDGEDTGKGHFWHIPVPA